MASFLLIEAAATMHIGSWRLRQVWIFLCFLFEVSLSTQGPLISLEIWSRIKRGKRDRYVVSQFNLTNIARSLLLRKQKSYVGYGILLGVILSSGIDQYCARFFFYFYHFFLKVFQFFVYQSRWFQRELIAYRYGKCRILLDASRNFVTQFSVLYRNDFLE